MVCLTPTTYVTSGRELTKHSLVAIPKFPLTLPSPVKMEIIQTIKFLTSFCVNYLFFSRIFMTVPSEFYLLGSTQVILTRGSSRQPNQL